MSSMFLLVTLAAPVGFDAVPLVTASAPLLCCGWGDPGVPAPAPCCESKPRFFSGLLAHLRRRSGPSDCGCAGGGSPAPAAASTAPPPAAGVVPTVTSTASAPDDGYRPLPTGANSAVSQDEPPVLKAH